MLGWPGQADFALLIFLNDSTYIYTHLQQVE
jgi:hypothetical protein